MPKFFLFKIQCLHGKRFPSLSILQMWKIDIPARVHIRFLNYHDDFRVPAFFSGLSGKNWICSLLSRSDRSRCNGRTHSLSVEKSNILIISTLQASYKRCSTNIKKSSSIKNAERSCWNITRTRHIIVIGSSRRRQVLMRKKIKKAYFTSVWGPLRSLCSARKLWIIKMLNKLRL